jgi:acetyl esterase
MTTLKPQLVALLEAGREAGMKPISILSPDDARLQMEATVNGRELPPVEGIFTEDRTIPGPAGEMPVRFYHPENAGKAPLGALVYYHGGGHVIGSINTHDRTARVLCRDSGILVMSVDYRMGPEDKFPAAVDDAHAAFNWLVDNAATEGVDAARIAVGGDSAGGNLALVVSLLARQAGGQVPAFQLLVYPVMDYAGGTPSYDLYGEGFGPLDSAAIDWFRKHYFNSDRDLGDWRATPRLAENFAGLPSTLIIAAECDVLNYEGRVLAGRLQADGVLVEHIDYEGMMHGFFSMAPLVDDAVEAQSLAAAKLKTALTG